MSDRLSHIFSRIKQQTYLVAFGHILNAPWKSRVERRKTRYKATKTAVMRYLGRYADAIRDIKPEPVATSAEPERAFTIWFQGEEQAPPLVKACFRSMRRNLKQELVVLDEKSIFDWITLPDYIVRKWKEGKIRHAHFSDICRVELLYQHGGLWFDATDLVTAPVAQNIMDEDVFLYSGGNRIRGSYAGVQNCFIRGRKGNPLLGIWREAMFLYWKNENSVVNYFVHHLLLMLSVEINDIAKEQYQKMPKIDQDPTHTLWTSDNVGAPYNEDIFKQLTKDSFFQKTNYKSNILKDIPSGSVADFIVNKS